MGSVPLVLSTIWGGVWGRGESKAPLKLIQGHLNSVQGRLALVDGGRGKCWEETPATGTGCFCSLTRQSTTVWGLLLYNTRPVWKLENAPVCLVTQPSFLSTRRWLGCIITALRTLARRDRAPEGTNTVSPLSRAAQARRSRIVSGLFHAHCCLTARGERKNFHSVFSVPPLHRYYRSAHHTEFCTIHLSVSSY